MKKILFIVLFPIILFAQTAWYVNTERTGAGTYDGTSWATAWNLTNSVDYWGANGTGIVWASIGAGDTIFFSGGTDTVFIDAEGAYGTVFRWSGTSDFSAGDPLIITEGKYSSNPTGHDGEVVFRNVTDKQNTLWIRQIINFKLVGITVTTTSSHSALLIGTGNYPPEDSMMTVQNCDILGVGLAGLIGTTANYVSILDNRIETFENAYPNDQDPMGFNTGLGHIVDGNTIICANDYEIISDTNLMDAGGMSVDDVSLTDTDLNMTTDYHVGNSVWVNGYYLQITSNTDDTFFGEGWLFDEIVQSNGTAVIITSTSLQDNNTESHNAGTLVGAVITAANGSKLLITSNSGTTFTGTAWIGTQPSNGTTYVIGGGDAPQPNLSWTMGGAHRDIIQISNLAPNAGNYFIFSNNLVIDTKEGGSGWNNIVYNYSDLATPHVSLVFYNNIIVSRKNITSPSLFALGSNYGEGGYTRWNSVKILQNTLMIKGEANGGAFLVSWAVDSVVVKNNLVVLDTTSEYFYSPENSSGLWASVIKDIDYNVYAKYGGITGSTQFGSSNLVSPDWDAWRTYDNYDASGVDANSLTYNSTAITFDEKYGLDIADYYTGIGRDAGENLLATYPFLRYDILGHERGYGSGWDIGALEFTGGPTPVDSTPSNVNFSIPNITNAEFNTSYTGNVYELADFDSAYARIDRGWYNVNGGTWKDSSQWTIVFPTNDIAVRDTTSSTYSDSKSITLTIGTESDTWTITNKGIPSSGSRIVNKTDGVWRLVDGKVFRTADTTTSNPIEYDSIPPNPPTSFVAIGGSSQTQFQTNWTNPTATDLDSIRYYESSSNDTTTMVWIVSLPAATGYLRTGRSANTTYYGCVKAVDDSGNVSYFSNVDSATTLTDLEGGTPLQNLNLVYLTQSFGQHLYDHSTVGNAGTTTMQAEMTAYNSLNGLAGSNAGTIYRYPSDYPDCGDMIWDWNQVMRGGTLEGNTAPTQNLVTDWITDTTYSIIQVVTGFNSGGMVDIPLDTVTYPNGHITENYKYWSRKMLSVMELYPDKYFIWWTIPPIIVPSSGSQAEANEQANFNLWMSDTLASGLDSYGAFPANVLIFDIFTELDSSNSLPSNYYDSPTDAHPNENAASDVAPIYIQRVFDNARAYRKP